MGRRRRKRVVPPRYCLRCKLERLPEETFPGGLCAACRHLNGKAHRVRSGARALARAKDAGTVDRDGQTFRVLDLPPTWRKRTV